MPEIIIRNQAELDALPPKFEQYTVVKIQSPAEITVTVRSRYESAHVEARGSAHVVAWESAYVEAWESAHVVARGSAHVVAWGSAYVEAWGSAHVVARGSAHVEAWGSAHVVAWESAHVEARESAHVVARGSAHVVAWGSAHVEAYESAHVEARGSAHVVAWGSAYVEAWGSAHVVARGSAHVEARESAHVVAWGRVSVHVHCDAVTVLLFYLAVCLRLVAGGKIIRQSPHASILDQLHDVKDNQDWLDLCGLEPVNGEVILYKRVSRDFLTQEGTANETHWAIGSTLEHPRWSPRSGECGDGKFHACASPALCDQFRDKKDDRYIAIEIAVEDLYAWPGKPEYPEKVGFRKGTVLYEVDRRGDRLAAEVSA